MKVSPVGGAGSNTAPALPPGEDPCRRPGTSKRIKLDPLPLLWAAVSLDLQPGRTPAALGRTAVTVHHYHPVVLPVIVVPEGVVPSLVLDAELYCVGGL